MPGYFHYNLNYSKLRKTVLDSFCSELEVAGSEGVADLYSPENRGSIKLYLDDTK